MKINRKTISRLALSLSFAAALFFAGCGLREFSGPGESDSRTPKERTVFAMTTVMQLQAYGKQADAALKEAQKEIETLDGELSIGNEQSEVAAVNRNSSGILSEDAGYLTEQSLKLYKETDGAFDFTIAPLMDLWGFTEAYSETPEPGQPEILKKEPPSEMEIRETLEEVGADAVRYDSAGRQLTLPEGCRIDFGGIAKGYASQKIMGIYRRYNLQAGIAELGGNVQVYGDKPDGTPWKVGIRDPDDPEELAGVLSITGSRAVVTSGGYERYIEDKSGKKYHHILDPKTGYPAESGLKSVTVIGSDGTRADGLSTSLFIMGEKKAHAYWRSCRNTKDAFDAVLITDDNRIIVTGETADSFSSRKGKAEVWKN